MESTPEGCPTPVLFLIQRRPEVTARVLEAIRQARPSCLLVAADGPEEDVLCVRTRQLVLAGIDWPCEVQTRFSQQRLGCRKAIAGALDWAFALHERLIVVEDDCLPDATFFSFCTELLERYENDPRVMQVCGSNQCDMAGPGGVSYFASRFAMVWGWASWRRAWRLYDATMAAWPSLRDSPDWPASCRIAGEAAWRRQLYDSACSGKIDAWSIAFEFARELNAGVSLIPSVNLVSNLGWGEGATHTHDPNDPRAHMKASSMSFPLRHPESLIPHDQADEAYFAKYCRPPSFPKRVLRKIHRLIKR